MLTRRALFRLAGAFGAGAAARPAPGLTTPPTAPLPIQGATDPYRAIGVRPLINCRGTLTIIGGSIELPEVAVAKTAANRQHAHLDEVMDAVGRRLAELTGAEWGMVSAGCAAAMSHATAACVAGGNPDLHVRIPNLEGFSKDEVIIPTHSRNVYDAAIRAVGVRILEVDTPAALQHAIGPKTAMIYIFAGPRNDSGPMSTEAIAAIAKAHDVPVFVDAAAEILTIPNVHLQRGATLVGYSGGKYLRGPQSAGLLLGRKDLVKAAWVHSAPHHGYARSMKVGREEMIGMLAAVESWVKRDHVREWAEWVSRCEHIASRVATIPGVSTEVQREPGPSLSNRSPRLVIRWRAGELGMTGTQVSEILDKGEPRIALGGGGGGGPDLPGDTGVSVTTAMMSRGDEKIVAGRLADVLSRRRSLEPIVAPAPPAANLSGRWDVEINYAASRTVHTLHLVQDGSQLRGLHQGDFQSRDITGSIAGDLVSLASIVTERHGDALTYRFTGKVFSAEGGVSLVGTLDLGEYLSATWTARSAPAARR